MRSRPPLDQGPLLTVRATLVFLLGSLAGACAGLLTAREGATLPSALLTAAASFAGAVMFFRTLIGEASGEPYNDQPGHDHVRPGEGEHPAPSPTRPASRPGSRTNSRNPR
ncbi:MULTISPECIES: hypothetical protein [Streptomyces]|uniref:hypothetical protein n=1 Tax=Streptomyces TaxID=1883 RepID=UPI000AA9CEB8|nr:MULTISPECIES: hypothetical protein [Streptomyces]